MGGNPGITVNSIIPIGGSTEIIFDPPAKPFQVTRYFVNNPITESNFADFTISIDNTTDTDQPIVIGAIYN